MYFAVPVQQEVGGDMNTVLNRLNRPRVRLTRNLSSIQILYQYIPYTVYIYTVYYVSISNTRTE